MHDEENQAKMGDLVAFEKTRPYSKKKHWKLIGTVENVDGRIRGSVGPVKLDSSHPLYSIGGATNAITYSTDLLGNITLIGPGAGRIETGYAIIGDILSFKT